MMDLSSGRGQFTSVNKLTYMALFIYLFGLTWGWLNTKGAQRYPPESDFSIATKRQKKQSMTTGILNSKEIKSEYNSKMLNFNFTHAVTDSEHV